ncbi:uncharacterized protein ABDE67_011344 [Symphorus nematophorus]
MSDKLPSQPTGTPTVFADGASFVSAREIKDVKAKGLLMNCEAVSDPGAGPAETAVGQVPQAQYTATGSSFIFADKMTNLNIDGVIDLSVTMTPSHARAGRVDEMLPSSTGPAVKVIRDHKVELIEYLMADHSFILQHVHAKHIVTDRQYQDMMNITQPSKTITDLIDHVIFSGQQSCSRFLEVLKDADVVRTYPQLKQITTKLC